KSKIHLLSIIGEIEGHENLSGSTKTTKYEHILPELAKVEDTDEIEGILVLINTVGGDVSCGLALAEMLASLSKPTVSLVIGDSHSIGVPLAVSTDYSFIVPSGTMLVHPVRMSGMLIGTSKTYEYFEMIQDRILSFVSGHSRVSYDRLKELMHNTKMLSKDLGTVLVGENAVEEGLIDEIGGIQDALQKLYDMIERKR
ncbi:MAG: ATP-dependent Clp protease proteolytic subunit, partial [Lachnospiraceae bacterium]|nr:ATP-dependent Clp protease proteolytic subunit [Lachnospiraceae bacterium]